MFIVCCIIDVHFINNNWLRIHTHHNGEQIYCRCGCGLDNHKTHTSSKLTHLYTYRLMHCFLFQL